MITHCNAFFRPSPPLLSLYDLSPFPSFLCLLLLILLLLLLLCAAFFVLFFCVSFLLFFFNRFFSFFFLFFLPETPAAFTKPSCSRCYFSRWCADPSGCCCIRCWEQLPASSWATARSWPWRRRDVPSRFMWRRWNRLHPLFSTLAHVSILRGTPWYSLVLRSIADCLFCSK